MRINRREWLASSGLLAASACRSPEATDYPGYALIATSGESSVAAVDLSTFRLLKPIALGAEPSAVVPGGPGSHVYVLTPKTGSVHVISPALKRVASARLSDQISGIRITADARRIYAVSGQSKQLIEVDPLTLRVLRRHKLSAEPAYFDLAETVPYGAVSTGAAGIVELFDLETGKSWRTQLPGAIGNLRFRADGKLLLVANLHERALTALSIPALEVIADLPLAMAPENLCFSDEGGQLFVTGEGMDGVAIVFPYRILEIDQTVLAGRDPGVMACSPDPSRFLFVGSHSGPDVCIMNIDRRKVVGTVDVGQKPSYITITPDGQYALILDESSGGMAVIRIPAIQTNLSIVRSRSGATLFTMLDVGSRPIHAAVIRKGA